MSKIIIPGQNSTRTDDSKKYKKWCDDFECLDDGTKTGEYKYCKWSLECRQVDFDEEGNEVTMEANVLLVKDPITGATIEDQLFCTGHIDGRPLDEKRKGDEKVS